MKTKYLAVLGALLLSLTLPVLSYAQATTEAEGTSATQPLTLTTGEIKRVDLDAGKVTIKHGEIKNLEMPPMTMVFIAKDRGQLANLKVGDKVNFVVLNEAGKFIAAEIQAVQ
jgi:Cu/Ag efflux protein CusF